MPPSPREAARESATDEALPPSPREVAREGVTEGVKLPQSPCDSSPKGGA